MRSVQTLWVAAVAVAGRGDLAAVRAGAAAAAARGARHQDPALRNPHATQRAARRRRLAERTAGGQPADARQGRIGTGPGRQARCGGDGRRPARSGHCQAVVRADFRRHRLRRWRARIRRRHRPLVRQHPGPEGQLRLRARPDGRGRTDAFVPAGRTRSRSHAGALGDGRQHAGPGVRRRCRHRSARLRIPSVWPARQRHAGVALDHHPRRPRAVPQGVVLAQQRPAGRGWRRQRRRGLRRRDQVPSASGSRTSRRCHAAGRRARADASRGARRPAQLDPDRDSRRSRRDRAQSPRLHGAEPGHQDSRRRGRQSPAERPPLREGPDLRRVGRHGRLQAVRARSSPRPIRRPRRPARRCGSPSTNSGGWCASRSATAS